MKRLLLCLSTAAMVVLVFPFVWPWRPGVEAWAAGWHEPLILVALVPMLLATLDRSAGRALLWGWLTGTLVFLGIVHWFPVATTTFGGLSTGISALLLVLAAGACGLSWGLATGAAAWLRRRHGWPAWIVLPPVWVAAELFRERLFPVFPWGHLGHSLARTPALAQLAALGGVGLVAALVALCNGAAYEAAMAWRAWGRGDGAAGAGGAVAADASEPGLPVTGRLGARAGLVVSSVALVVSLGWGGARLALLSRAETGVPRLDVVVIQPNIDQRVKNVRGRYTAEIFEAHLGPTRAAQAAGAALVVWPEAAIPRRLPGDPEHLRTIRELAPLSGGGGHLLLTGVPQRERGEGWRLSNAVLLTDDRLRVLGRYDKRVLVPFAEYVPFENVLPVGSILPGGGRFDPGGEPRALALPGEEGDVRLGAYVCYDAVFPSVARALVRDGADVLVLPTNDAWYGRSAAPFQFVRITAMRSVEAGRWTVRAANTGVSGFIDGAGRVYEATALGLSPARGRDIGPGDLVPPQTIRRDVPLLGGRTPYVVLGRWADGAAVLAVLGLVGLALRRRG